MAHVYAKVGEEQKGVDYYERALSLFKLAHHPNGEAATLYSMGRIYYSIDEKKKALESQLEALKMCRALGDRRLEILVLIEIGRLYDFAGDKPAALKNFLLARSFAQSQKDLRAEMDIWNLLGITYESQGKKQVALDCYKRALALSREAQHRFGETATLYQIARAHFDSSDLSAARLHTEEAINLIESLRTKVNRQELRASYFASVRQLYELYIDVLMELHAKDRNAGYDVLAFEASEQARGRSLLEMVATARIGARENVDPELLARERQLREELSKKAEQRMMQSSSSREADTAVVDRELDDLTSRYQEVRAQIRAVSLENTDQTAPRPLGLQEIRDRDLTDDSALLEFSLGERRSYLWFITKDSFKSWPLPPRREIEQSALAIRNLLVRPAAIPGESPEELRARMTAAEDEYWEKAAVFSETLLGPVAKDLGTKRLLIVADGALQYLPFGALPVPSRGEEVIPLMMEHEISFQPSASVLAMLRSRAAKPHGKAIAIFADPVFELNDSRFEKSQKPLVAAVIPREDHLERALRDANISWGTGSIPRLLASREEAEAIINLVPVSDNLKAVDFDANKETATNLDLSRYQIIHIATHGMLDSRRPELSGLLLSRFDKDGQPKEGVLRLDDIYNLNLSAAMVVLSACNTGLGKDVRGEGLVGLVHGFMYAGTSRVVASLWKVDDDATAQLMVNFYSEMFQSGKSPAAALRAAQIAMWQQKRWRAPYFWAAFVLHGDYEGRVDDIRTQSSTRAWQVGAIVVIVIASGLFFFRRKLRNSYDHG